MTTVTKVLLAAAILCFLIWGFTLSVGLQPLVAASGFQVIYGDGEDFFSDAVAYRKVRNEFLLLLHLPRARPAYRWWTVDLKNEAIALSGPPRSLSERRYIVKGDLDGSNIADPTKFRDWYWHFTTGGASFSGDGFMCSVHKIRIN